MKNNEPKRKVVHLDSRTLKPVREPDPKYFGNYRFNFLDEYGHNIGHIDMFIDVRESGNISQSLGRYFKGAGLNIHILGAVAPVNPELGQIAELCQKILKKLDDSYELWKSMDEACQI